MNCILNFSENLSLNNKSSKIYGELCAELDKKVTRVPQFNLLNVSNAIANKLCVIIKNKRHFPKINELSEFEFLELCEDQ